MSRIAASICPRASALALKLLSVVGACLRVVWARREAVRRTGSIGRRQEPPTRSRLESKLNGLRDLLDDERPSPQASQRWILRLKLSGVRNSSHWSKGAEEANPNPTAETHILIHAFLTAQQLPKAAAALTKELGKKTANLGNEVEEESSKHAGTELVRLVRAKIDFAKDQ